MAYCLEKTTFNGEGIEQLVLPTSLTDTIFKAYHDDLGHQGRDRTTSLIRRRFFWPGMNEDIKKRVSLCERCVRRKTAPTKATELVNITSTSPMELVCIDYLSLEKSKGGQENILVITDHFSRYAQAIPTQNQKAQQLKFYMKISSFIMDSPQFYIATKERILNLKLSESCVN